MWLRLHTLTLHINNTSFVKKYNKLDLLRSPKNVHPKTESYIYRTYWPNQNLIQLLFSMEIHS